MRDKLRNNLIIFLVLMAILTVDASFAACNKNLNEGIQKIIDENRIKYQIPGVEVSVSCPNEDMPRDFVSGTTTIDGVVSIQPDHLFQVGSETKSFIAAVILQLEAEGRLSIYDPIGYYLSTIPYAWQGITIQQLLNHTSGIFNYTQVPEFWKFMQESDYNYQWSSDELIAYAKEKEPNFFPGLGWSYSNTNYVLAGLLVEAVTGKSIEEELKTRLFQPLHLSNTYYYSRVYSYEILSRMAHGYSFFGVFSDEPKDITDKNISWANAAGAILSTSHDMAIWLKHLLTDDKLLDYTQRQELLSFVNMKDGQLLPPGSNENGYGLGIVKFNSPVGEYWGHGGGTLGYISHMYWLNCNNIAFTLIVNQIKNIEMEGLGSSAIAQEIIHFIQQTDTNQQCKPELMLRTKSLSKQFKNDYRTWS